MLTVKYFAYGSNISIERLRGRVESRFEPLAPGVPYTLENYALTFNANSFYGGWSFANIVPMQGYSVEGILYDMSPEQFERLDRYEALYEKQYFQINPTTIGCVYIAKRENTTTRFCKPTLEYLNIIIDGCKETGLMKTYEILVGYKQKNYKLKASKHKTVKKWF